MNKKGFTLVEVVISVGLLSVVSLVSVSIVTNLLRSTTKSQVNMDIEQTSSFVLLKMENDISKAYSASIEDSGGTLKLLQGASMSPTEVVYKIVGSGSDRPNYITVQYSADAVVNLTDNTWDTNNSRPGASAVSVDTNVSKFSLVEDSNGKPLAVNVTIKFVKPNTADTKNVAAESTLETTVVLKEGY